MDADALINRLRARLPSYDMHRDGPAPPPAPPLDPGLIPGIEAELGFSLPPLLTRIYTDLGNGGFGPGYGLLGLGPDGFCDDQGQSADRAYAAFRTPSPTPPFFRWPEAILPICHFGCAIYHCVDAATHEVLVWEPTLWSGQHSVKTAIFHTEASLADWLQAWADGHPVPQFRQDPPLTPLAVATPRTSHSPTKPHKDQLTFLDKL